MTREAQLCDLEDLAASAVHRMETRGIVSMPAVDGAGRLAGTIHLHDCMRAGVV